MIGVNIFLFYISWIDNNMNDDHCDRLPTNNSLDITKYENNCKAYDAVKYFITMHHNTVLDKYKVL